MLILYYIHHCICLVFPGLNKSVPFSFPFSSDQNLVNTGTHTSVDYTPNTLNQYSLINTNSVVTSPTYDEDGNLTDDDRFTYGWNGENRLLTVTPNSPAIGDKKLDLSYDFIGRRVKKVTTEWDGSVWQLNDTSLFVYDGWNMIEELVGGGNKKASYLHGLDLSGSLQGAGGIGGILARVDNDTGDVHSYFYDGNGNVGQMVDSSDGSVAAAYEYAPFGGLISSKGTYADSESVSARYAVL